MIGSTVDTFISSTVHVTRSAADRGRPSRRDVPVGRIRDRPMRLQAAARGPSRCGRDRGCSAAQDMGGRLSILAQGGRRATVYEEDKPSDAVDAADGAGWRARCDPEMDRPSGCAAIRIVRPRGRPAGSGRGPNRRGPSPGCRGAGVGAGRRAGHRTRPGGQPAGRGPCLRARLAFEPIQDRPDGDLVADLQADFVDLATVDADPVATAQVAEDDPIVGDGDAAMPPGDLGVLDPSVAIEVAADQDDGPLERDDRRRPVDSGGRVGMTFLAVLRSVGAGVIGSGGVVVRPGRPRTSARSPGCDTCRRARRAGTCARPRPGRCPRRRPSGAASGGGGGIGGRAAWAARFSSWRPAKPPSRPARPAGSAIVCSCAWPFSSR